jgi:hypothetical protein
MDQHSLQEMIDEGPGQRENLRQFIDKLVHEGYSVGDAEGPDPMLVDPGGRAVETWREDYPYDTLLTRDEYEAEKYKLQVELLKLQYWSQDHDVRHIILFEGRDAAGKGGTIKRFTEHLNPRAARVVALTKPTTTELGQWYFQRYIEHFPTVRRDRDVRPLLVQPGRRRAGHGLLHRRAVRDLHEDRRPSSSA